jgi:hypothetical protein
LISGSPWILIKTLQVIDRFVHTLAQRRFASCRGALVKPFLRAGRPTGYVLFKPKRCHENVICWWSLMGFNEILWWDLMMLIGFNGI